MLHAKELDDWKIYVRMARSTSSGDTDPFDGGDLGLGKGLKPGALPFDDDEQCELGTSPSRTVLRKVGHLHILTKPIICSSTNVNKHGNSIPDPPGRSRCQSGVGDSSCIADPNSTRSSENAKGTLERLSEKLHKLRNPRNKSCDGDHLKLSDSSESSDNVELSDNRAKANRRVPIFAEVPLGTSLRQQKELFEKELQELLKNNHLLFDKEEAEPVDSNSPPNGNGMSLSYSQKRDYKVVQQKLTQAEEEVDLLKQDLELCQNQLESKYKAITILQKQAFASQNEQVKTSRKSTQLKRTLEEEINTLQFQMEYRQGCLMNSQQNWTDRCEQLTVENASLTALLQGKTDQVNKAQAEKMVISRERDELLALLSVQERQRYESSRSGSTDDPYCHFSSAELAILGACHCRVREPDPCGCSHAAARLKREVLKLKEEVAHEKKHTREALTTTDAYRMAFEEQLGHNHRLVKQLAEMTSTILNQKANKIKVKDVVRFLIHQLNEDVTPPPKSNGQLNGAADEHKEQPSQTGCDEDKTLEELILMLVDMISDKTEALAHQKLAARMLANRTRELEEKLSELTDEVFHKPDAS